MITKLLNIALAGLVFGLFLFLAGCSSDNGSGADTTVAEETGDQIAEDDIPALDTEEVAAVAQADQIGTEQNVSLSADNTGGKTKSPILDVIQKDTLLYLLLENGLAVHRLTDGNNTFITSPSRLGAMVEIEGKIFAGGDNLYTLEGDYFSAGDFNLKLAGFITVLEPCGQKLMVGTSQGLYEVSQGGVRELAADIFVSAMQSEPGGVWVGTSGNGLYFWNGQDFHKRYLKRDPALFDQVTALDFSHDHLYLGTNRGLYIFDGGRWQSFGLADGLPSETITAIDAGDWVVKVGTANGAVDFFNNEFKLIAPLEGVAVHAFVQDGRKLYMTTAEGLVMKSGGLLTRLFDGDMNTPPMAVEATY